MKNCSNWFYVILDTIKIIGLTRDIRSIIRRIILSCSRGQLNTLKTKFLPINNLHWCSINTDWLWKYLTSFPTSSLHNWTALWRKSGSILACFRRDIFLAYHCASGWRACAVVTSWTPLRSLTPFFNFETEKSGLIWLSYFLGSFYLSIALVFLK